MNKKTPALVNLAIYTTITVFLWIFFDVYRALKKPLVIDVDKKILEPLNPNLNKNSLEDIKEGIYFYEDMANSQSVETNSLNESPETTTSGQIKE